MPRLLIRANDIQISPFGPRWLWMLLGRADPGNDCWPRSSLAVSAGKQPSRFSTDDFQISCQLDEGAKE
ncbi:hypothetical protein [Ensifer aridi]|uniref:hypothetical protein n=1 Tax=Ensifer aridi TaxID=1708715 RepID=UPI00111BD99E|nr:hypothetical protein [Ensifer aridi]